MNTLCMLHLVRDSLQERIISIKEKFIISIQAVYVSTDNLTDPASTMIFAHLDAAIILPRWLAAKDIYTTVDPLDSMWTMLQPRILGEEHYEIDQIKELEQTLQYYKGHYSYHWIRWIIRRGLLTCRKSEKKLRFLIITFVGSNQMKEFPRLSLVPSEITIYVFARLGACCYAFLKQILMNLR